MTAYWDGWQIDAVLVLALLALAVYIWRLMGLVGELGRQQERMRQSIEQMPTAIHVTDLRLQLARLEALVEATSREVHTTGTRLRRVEDYLMEAKRRNDHDSKF